MKPLHKNHPREEEHRRHLSEGEHQRHPREEEHRSHPGGGEQPSHRVLLSTTPTNRTMTKRGREEDVLLRRDQGDHCEELGRREARGCRRSPSRDARPSHRGQEHKGSTHQEHRAPVVGSERPSSDKERTGRYHSATYHVHRQEQRALATEAIRTSPERERIGKPNAATYRRSYAEATKGAIEASDRGDGRRLDRPSDRVTPIKKTDDEGEWILVKPKRVRREEKKAEKAASSTSSATPVAKKNALCHKCAERGHTIHECTNDWFCYVCKRYGHISKSCPRSVKSGSAQSKASAEVPFVGGCSKPVKAESEESRDGRRMVIREVISPTPIMGEFERRLTNSILLKVHTGFPSIEAIKELLSDSVRPTSRLEWDVKKLKEDTLMVSCKTDEITRELLAIGSLEGEDFYITMSRWSRAFGALKVDAKASLWIRLFNIPLQCWVRSGFQNLIHSFGSLVSIDKNTTFLLRCEYARIQVAVDDVSLIPSVIVAQFEEEKYEIKVIVERKKKVSFRSAPEYSGSNSDVGCKQRDKEEDEHHPSDQTWRNLSHRFGAQDPVRESALIRDQIEYTEQHIPTGPSANLSIGCREEGRVAGVSPRQRPVVGSAIDATGEAGSAVGDSSIRTAGSLRRVLDEEEATDAGRSLRPAVFSQKDNRALDLHKKQPQKLDGAVFSSEVVGQKQPQKLHQSDGGGAGFEGRKFELGQASCGPTKSEAELMGLNSAQFKQALDLAVKTITLSLLQSGPGQWAKQDLRSEAENPVSTTPTQALTAIPSEAAQLTSGRSVGEEFGEQNDPVPVDIGGPVTGEIKQGLMEDSTTMDGIIGALNDVEKESTNSDEEFEKWENEVKTLTPVIEESAESDVRETVSGVEETKRKSKRQIDRWGAKGPSEEDLIRAAAKAKEPMSACGGKDLLMEDRIYCRPPRRSANLISNRRKPGQVSKPITKSVTTIGENGVAYAKGEQGENGVKLTKGFDVPSLPARKRLRAAVMKPIPHTRHYRMLLFIPETNGLDASQVKPIPVVPVKHNVLLLAPTHRKSTLSSFHNQQIVPLNPLPMKKHGCDDCDRPPIQVCKEEEFLKDVMQFLTSRGHSRLVPVGGISEFPDAVLNAKRLDLYNLYREVVSRGGFYVGNGINWKGQVFSNMRNHTMTNRMTGVGNTLKRHYETYLLEYELAHDDVGGECCLLCHSSAPGDWVNCGVCGEWAHFGCDGRPRLGTFKEYAKTDGLEYICPHCSLANKRTQKTANGLCRASPAAPRVI